MKILFNLCVFLFLSLVVRGESGSGLAPNPGGPNNFITWNDLTVNYDQRFSMGNSLGIDNGDRVIVVDKDGRGDSRTVQGAVDMVPLQNSQRVKIHILPGIYSEKVYVPMTKPSISFIGDMNNPSQTVITWHDKASDPDGAGGSVGTYRSASVNVEANYFCAAGITFQNSVVAQVGGVDGYQAVAMKISGDKSVFYKVRFIGTQDTLLDESGTHYFFKCFIQGATDFIFGNAKSLYQECTISVVSPGFAIAAQHRDNGYQDTGYSFVNCTVTGTSVAGVYLGRAWGDYSRVIYSNCILDINVMPAGWNDWGAPSRHRTTVFGEYQCTGRGANRSGREPWSIALSYNDAKPFMDTNFISGNLWLRLSSNLSTVEYHP